MKMADLDNVNHLAGALREVEGLIRMAEAADAEAFQLFIEAPGDASLKMSSEGASTTHSNGIDVSAGFLTRLKDLAIAELRARREATMAELAKLGVDATEG